MMKDLGIVPRSSWRAAPPRRPEQLKPLEPARLTHLVNHWPGDARNLAGMDTAELLRGWQRYHQRVRGWNDLGYNYVVDAAGTIWEGRGWYVGGHVLGDQNAISVGVCYAIGNSEAMTPAMMNAGHALRAYIEGRAGRELRPIGHSDWANKLCPGPQVLRWTRLGMPLGGLPTPPADPAPTPAPPAPPAPSKVGETAAPPAFPLGVCRTHRRAMWYGPRSASDHQVSGWVNVRSNGRRGADGLFTFQHRMAYRGWRITPDGLWGPETDRVVRAFQAEKGLAVDGAVGRNTWAAAWSAPIT